MLESETGVQALKERGLKVIRDKIRKGSSIIGKTAVECGFRDKFKAAIVAYQRGGKTGSSQSLSSLKFMINDALVLQASDDSPLLVEPPSDFYKNLDAPLGKQGKSRSYSGSSLTDIIRSISNTEINLLGSKKVKNEKASKKTKESSTNIEQNMQSNMVDEENDFGFIDLTDGNATDDTEKNVITTTDGQVSVSCMFAPTSLKINL